MTILFETWRAARTAVEAEFDLHAGTLTYYLVADFVTDTHRWPTSWRELFNHGQTGAGRTMWTLPADEDELIRRVSLRFGISLEDVARQGANPDFLSTNGPVYRRALESKLQLVVGAAGGVADEVSGEADVSPIRP